MCAGVCVCVCVCVAGKHGSSLRTYREGQLTTALSLKSRPAMTFPVDWALKANHLSSYPIAGKHGSSLRTYREGQLTAAYSLKSRPHVTFVVDWALKANYLSIYQYQATR